MILYYTVLILYYIMVRLFEASCGKAHDEPGRGPGVQEVL